MQETSNRSTLEKIGIGSAGLATMYIGGGIPFAIIHYSSEMMKKKRTMTT